MKEEAKKPEVKKSFAAEIWQTFQAIELSGMVEKKMQLSYLSWAWAWSLIMQHYPESTIDEQKEESFDNGEMDIVCTLTIRDGERTFSRTMRLPVMDNRNNPIKNPNRRQVNDSKQRCFVKCAAMFGLGISLYRGEDIPTAEEIEKQNEDKKRNEWLNQWISAINKAETPEQLNVLVTDAGKLDNGLNETRQIKSAIMARANALNFDFDTNSKTFERKAA